MRNLFHLLRSSLLARNTLWMSAGHGARLVIQAIYFVLIARSLGAEGYGTFIGMVSLALILAPFSSLGTGNLIVKNVSRDPAVFERYWGNSLMMTLISGSLLTGVVLLIYPYVLPSSVSLPLVLCVTVAEVFFTRILDNGRLAFQAFQQLKQTAQLQVILSSSRLVAALGLSLLSASPTPVEWGMLYLLATALSACAGFVLVHRKLGKPRPNLRALVPEIKEGFYFSFSLSSQALHNDMDKTLLSRLSTLQDAGIYAAAYRIIDVSFTPVWGLMGAAYARFFQHGTAGLAGSVGFARRLLPVAGAYALLAGIALYLMAPLLPYVLGDDYQEAGTAIRWLALLPFLRAVQVLVADTLTGAGFQGIRSGVQGLVALLNILANLALIPLYSWRAAAVVGVVSEALLALGLWIAVLYIRGREQH